MSAGELEQEFSKGHFGFTLLHGLLWAGTRKHHRQGIRTRQELLSLMEDASDDGKFDFQEIVTACMEAYQAAQPSQKAQDQDKPTGLPKGKTKETA